MDLKRGVTRIVLLCLVIMAGLSTQVMAATELQLMTWSSQGYLDKYLEFANNYMKEHHPDVTVVGTTTAGTGADYRSKVIVSIAGGAGPDLYAFNLADFDPKWVNDGLMLSVDDLVAKDTAFKRDVPPGLLEAWRYQGQLYGIPYSVGQYAVFYNRDRFAEVGLPVPALDWTLAGDFKSSLMRLKKVDSAGKLERYGISLETTSIQSRFMNYVMSNGANVVDEQVTKARTDEPAFIETLEFFKGLMDEGGLISGNLGNAFNRFVGEQVGTFMSGIFYQPRVVESAKFNWGIATFPKGTAGRQTIINSNAWVINPQSQHRELLGELAKAFASPEFAKFSFQNGTEFPVSRSGLQAYFFGTLPRNLSRQEGNIWLDAIDDLRAYPKSAVMPDVWKVMEAQLKPVWQGKVAPKTAATMAAEQINDLIKASKN